MLQNIKWITSNSQKYEQNVKIRRNKKNTKLLSNYFSILRKRDV